MIIINIIQAKYCTSQEKYTSKYYKRNIQANIQELSVEQAQAAFNNLAENINTLMNPTDVMLTNVTFYDKASETAAIVDGLIINRVGHFKYLKLQD